MNSAERIDTVVQLGVPDRVPLAPLLDHFAATYAGITNHELMYDPDKRIAAITRVLRELGPWDMTFLADTANGPLLEVGLPMQMMRPGYELPVDEIHQFVEKPVMQPSDYERVVEVGFRQFRAELLALPFLERIIDDLVASGITPLLHCDTNWTRFFEYFRSFPRGSCILELDGASDIFKAKEMLGDVMCIMGDAPAVLLSFATAEKVRDYCRRLIEVVGEGGGFILSSGCSIPPNARPENVRVMRDAVEEYGWY